MFMKKIFISLFLFFLTYSLNVFAEKIDVIWTGFSINTDYRDLDRSAYYTNKLLNKYNGKQNIIDQTLQKEIRSKKLRLLFIGTKKSLIIVKK